jgi:hypothetical protein
MPRKRRLLSQTALDYLRLLKNPEVKIRFDIVEVLLADGDVREIRHLSAEHVFLEQAVSLRLNWWGETAGGPCCQIIFGSRGRSPHHFCLRRRAGGMNLQPHHEPCLENCD